MQHRPIPLILTLLAATTAMGQAGADVRLGKLAARDLAAHLAAKLEGSENPAKRPPPACSWITSSNAEEATLARRLALVGLCPTDIQPADEAEPGTSGSTTIRGQGACSVVGKVGQSC